MTNGLTPIAHDRVLSADRAAALYPGYLAAFAHLRTEAAARHVLEEGEFTADMADPRIVKYTAWHSPTEPVAMATLTNELDAVPWISPDFFAARWPEHAARSAIYYLGFALAVPGRGQFKLLYRLLEEIARPIAAERGVLAYDVCTVNERALQFGRRAANGLARFAPVQVSVADTQIYYQAVFE